MSRKYEIVAMSELELAAALIGVARSLEKSRRRDMARICLRAADEIKALRAHVLWHIRNKAA